MNTSRVKMGYKTAISRYYRLSKPGIVYSNTLTAIAGYLYASAFRLDLVTLVGLAVGIALLIAGACAYNNYLDRGLDVAMERTQKRALVTGELSSSQALGYATLATLTGLGLLAVTQNALTFWLTVIAFIDYVVLYGWGKRQTVHGTLIGTISGSLPLVAGYTAVTNSFDIQAVLLFALMFAWQMAHFYAIALYRLEDYKAARIPVMPAVYGVESTKIQTVLYMIVFVGGVAGLILFGDLGILAGGVLAVLGLWWLLKAVRSYKLLSPKDWGRNVFIASLTIILAISGCLAVGPLLV